MFANFLDIGQGMGGEEQGAALVAQLPQQLLDAGARQRVEPAHRLIQNQQVGFGQQACCQPQLLRHALRIRAHRLVQCRRLQIERGKHGAHFVFAGGAPVQLEHIAEEVAAGEEIRRHEPLRQESQPCAGAAIGVPGAEYFDPAGIDVAEVEQAFDQRGLAGAIDADQTEGHARGDVEVDPLQHRLAAIVFPDLVEADGRLCHWMR